MYIRPKDLEKDLQARLLPALKRARIEIDKLISKLEERMAKRKSEKDETQTKKDEAQTTP